MDRGDLDDIGEALSEFFDQQCTITSNGQTLGTFDCLVLSQAATGRTPDPLGAQATDLDSFIIYMLPESGTASKEGSRIVTTSGLDLGIGSSDWGKSLAAFVTVQASKQGSGSPLTTLILARWNPTTKVFDALAPQSFQVVISGNQPRQVTIGGRTLNEYDGTLLGDLTVNVRADDRFTYNDMPGRVTSVNKSDRTEATMVLVGN